MTISILVVDDQRDKIGRIVECLQSAGVARRDIFVAQTGADARKLLMEKKFDLLVLDIALPMFAEDPPDRKGGISLLEELSERDSYKLPNAIVGLTQYSDLRAEFDAKFRSRLWTLDQYAIGDSSWLSRLKAKVEYIRAAYNQGTQPSYEYDLCVVTALPSPELEGVKRLNWNWGAPVALDEVAYAYEGTFSSDGNTFRVVATAAPRAGMVASALLSLKAITRYRPRLLAMAGICAGVGESALGDVILADPAWDYQMGKHANGNFFFAPDQIQVPTEISQRFGLFAREDRTAVLAAYDKYEGEKPTRIPSLRIGPVGSGSSVIADDDQIETIQRQHRKTAGIEMELYGVYAAARDCPLPRPKAFGLKSVCDFGDGKKNDKYQKYCSYMSATVLQLFMEKYGADLIRGC
ncbi:MAG: response regulator [Gemmatimonas sp.]